MVYGIGDMGLDSTFAALWNGAAGTASSGEGGDASLDGGDTVVISDEARSMLQAALDKYEDVALEDMTDSDKEEVRDALVEALGSARAQEGTGTAAASGTEDATDAGGGEDGSAPAASGGGAAGGASGNSGTSTEDQIEDLETEIEELEQEIEELRPKAAHDDEAKAELKGKETELAAKQNELAQLENQQESA